MSNKLDQTKGHIEAIAGIATGNEKLQDAGGADVRAADRSARAAKVKKGLDDTFDKVADKVETGLHGKKGAR